MKTQGSSCLGMSVLCVVWLCVWTLQAQDAPRAFGEGMNVGALLVQKPASQPADWIVEHEPVNPNASPEARRAFRAISRMPSGSSS